MRYQTVPLPFVGGKNQSRSRYWASEDTINLYLDYQESGRSNLALLPWPGEKPFSTGAGVSRGMVAHNGYRFLVSGTELVRIDSLGARTSIGTIPGSNRCSMVSNDNNLVIRTGTETYFYNNVTLEKITDPDLENGQTVDYLKTFFLYQGAGGRFTVSDAGTVDSVDGLNFATAEAQGDDLVQLFVFREQIYLGGARTIEPWYISGSGNPPIDPVTQGVIPVGVASPFCMASSVDSCYFLGSDGVVYRLSGYQVQPVSTSSIAAQIRALTQTDAEGYLVRIDGQSFYVLNFPSGDKTFAYSEQTKTWITLSTGVNGGRHLISGYAYLNNKHYISDYRNGNVYEWDFSTHQSNATTLIRQRDSNVLNGSALRKPGSKLIMNRAQIIMETGVGNSSAENPLVMISASFDGGRSFTAEKWVELGREGEAIRRIEWYHCAEFYDLVLRVRVSDPCFVAIHDAAVDIKLAGH